MNNGMEKEIFEIYLEDIIPNRFQPRLSFDDKSLTELAQSIKEHGIIQPLVLRKVGDKYEIIAGERRYKAATMAGLQKVPAVVMNLDDNKSAELAVVENIQRQNLNAIEEAESYKKLLDRNYLTQEQLASRMGKNQSTISNKLRLLNLDDQVREAVLNEKISERHARSLLSLKNPADQKDVLNKIINNKLTVKQTDDLIKSMTGVAPSTSGDDDTSTGTEGVQMVPPVQPAPIIPPQELPVQPVYMNEPANQEVAEPNLNSVTPTDPIIPLTNNSAPGLDDLNVNKIKEESLDINPVKTTPNFESLLSVNDGVGQPQPINNLEPNINTPPVVQTVNQNRFIPSSLEDEETDMNMGEIAPSIATPKFDLGINQPQQPNLNVNNNQEELVDALDVNTPLVQPVLNPIEPPVTPEPPMPNNQAYNQSQPNLMFNQAPTGTNLKDAIGTVRDVVKELERRGFTIDVEEFDFEHLYQMIIKIKK